jgi:Acyl-CoA dehydrogenase, C-terminal domain
MSIRPFDLPSADTDVVAAARIIVSETFPISRLRDDPSGEAARWRVMAEAGWIEPWPELIFEGTGLSTLCHIATAAGSVALVDEFVNNVVILPSLAARAGEATGLAAPGFAVERVSGQRARAFGFAPGLQAVGLGWLCDEDKRDEPACRIWEHGELEVVPGQGTSAAVVSVSLPAESGHAEQTELTPEEQRRLRGAAIIVHASALVGLGYEAIRRTRDYLLVREQFGGPIARYQALQHMLADAYIQLETAWTLCEHAAESRDDRAIGIARFSAVAASNAACLTMQQLFGGIGFTAEMDCHVLTKAALAGRYRFEPAELIARRMAEALIGNEGAERRDRAEAGSI